MEGMWETGGAREDVSGISGHFQSLSSRCFQTYRPQVFPDRYTDGCKTICCMYVLYGIYTGDVSRILIWGIFSE